VVIAPSLALCYVAAMQVPEFTLEYTHDIDEKCRKRVRAHWKKGYVDVYMVQLEGKTSRGYRPIRRYENIHTGPHVHIFTTTGGGPGERYGIDITADPRTGYASAFTQAEEDLQCHSEDYRRAFYGTENDGG
jgi:hypothetical protein